MARKVIHHMDFETLLLANREVVALTREPHEYSQADGEKLSQLVKEVEQRANNVKPEEAVREKAALLVFKVASGQYFRAGNKRTALVAGSAFLAKNGIGIDITDPEFVSRVDQAGVAAAGLDDVYEIVRRIARDSKVDRRGWAKAVAAVVESEKDFLTKLGS